MGRLSSIINLAMVLAVLILSAKHTTEYWSRINVDRSINVERSSDPTQIADVQDPDAMTTQSTEVVMVTQKTKPATSKARTDIDWNKMFSFVPYSIIYCNNITIHLPKEERVPAQLKAQLDDYEQVVIKQMELSEQRYGGAENFDDMLYIYDILSKQPFVKTFCETGFNAGHSAYTWLLGSNTTKVYSFDIGVHDYCKDMAKYLQERFPGRLHVTWGNSRDTLPAFREEYPDVKCDVMLIDGAHRYAPCQSDYDNFRQMASDDNIVIIDDYPRKSGDWLKYMGDVWEPAKRRGEISEIFSCVDQNRNHGFAVAHYNKI